MIGLLPYSPSVHCGRLGVLLPPLYDIVGRYLKLSDLSTFPVYEDQIGDETRELIDDRGLIGDGIITITFDASIDEIDYIEPDLTATTATISGAWTIPSGVEVYKIEMYNLGVLVGTLYLQEGNDTILLDKNGYHAVLSDAGAWTDVIVDKSENNDSNENGFNNAAYFDGTAYVEFDEVVLRADEQWFIDLSVINPVKTTYETLLGNSDIKARMFTDANGTIFFYSDQSPLNTYTGIVNAVSTLRIECDGNGNVSISSEHGTDTNTFSLTDTFSFNTLGKYGSLTRPMIGYICNVNINNQYVDPLNGSTTGTATNVNFGRLTLPSPDIFGRDDLHTGKAKFNSESTGGLVGVSDGTAQLQFTDLTGVTIVDFEGTDTPVIVGNNINFPAGQYSYLELSDGTIIYFNGHLRKSNLDELVTGVNFTFENSDTLTQGTIDGQKDGYYLLSTGEKVIKPQFTLPAGAIHYEGGKGDNLIGDITYSQYPLVSLGYIPYQLFDLTAQVGNVEGKAPIWLTTVETFRNTIDPFRFTPEMRLCSFWLTHLNPDFYGYGYIKNLIEASGATYITDVIVYIQKIREDQQADELSDYCPQYTPLPELVTDLGEVVTDEGEEVTDTP
jgi:hypothetical protein